MKLSTNVLTHKVLYYLTDTKEELKTVYVTKAQLMEIAKSRNARNLVSLPGVAALAPELIRTLTKIDKDEMKNMEKPKTRIEFLEDEIVGNELYSRSVIKTIDRATGEIISEKIEKVLVKTYTEDELKRHREIAEKLKNSDNPARALLKMLHGE